MGSSRLVRRLRKFFQLDRADRRLVLQAAVQLWKYRLMLWLTPWSRIRARVEGAGPPPRAGVTGPAAPERVAWAVRAVAPAVPRSSCLVQALAAQTLCARHGHPSAIRFGTARGHRGEFEAHAWLEAGDTVVIGAEEMDRYRQFTWRGVPGA